MVSRPACCALCGLAPLPGLRWCRDCVLFEADDIEDLVAALELIIDGTIESVAADQQLDVLGTMAGLAPAPER